MSISRPKEKQQKNPAVKFIKWKSGIDQGYAEYYDKEAKKNIQIELKNFAVLDQDLFSVTGFLDALNCGLSSNEVRTNKELITVRGYKDGKAFTHATGSYDELKERIQSSREMNRTKCIYLFMDKEILHLQLSGSGYAAWIEYVEGPGHAEGHWLSLNGTKKGKKGAVHWVSPTFEAGETFSDDDINKLVAIDSEILQPYLKDYFARDVASSQSIQVEHVGYTPSEVVTPASDCGEYSWMSYEYKGKLLGLCNQEELTSLASELLMEGENQTEEYKQIACGLKAYRDTGETWADKKDRDGRALSDYSEQELTVLLAKVSADNPARILMSIALAQFDNDIPF